MQQLTKPGTANSDEKTSSQAAGFAWYGKFPSAGDFISRRMPYPFQQYWDRWCAAGMEALIADHAASGWALWRSTPTWAFLLPAQPAVPLGQLGVLAPSCDRVGRNFPFLVTSSLMADNLALLLPRAAALGFAWGDVIAKAQVARQSIDLLDDQLATELAKVLASDLIGDDSENTMPRGANWSVLPWPDLATTFDIKGSESYWWSVPPVRTGFQARIHTGALNDMHFLGLCS
jgi:type VI secretion system protein ImpM